MNNELIKLANHLDKKGFHKEADYLDSILKLGAEQTEQLDSRKFYTEPDLIRYFREHQDSQPRVKERTTSESDGADFIHLSPQGADVMQFVAWGGLAGDAEAWFSLEKDIPAGLFELKTGDLPSGVTITKALDQDGLKWQGNMRPRP